MKYACAMIAASFIFMTALSGQANAALLPSLALEKSIAYQQGQFGALYAHCGSLDDKIIIGGSLASWRTETFRGYNGSPAEHKELEKAFDQAAQEVVEDQTSCQDWLKQAAVTWHSIVHLSQYGLPQDHRS